MDVTLHMALATIKPNLILLSASVIMAGVDANVPLNTLETLTISGAIPVKREVYGLVQLSITVAIVKFILSNMKLVDICLATMPN